MDQAGPERLTRSTLLASGVAETSAARQAPKERYDP